MPRTKSLERNHYQQNVCHPELRGLTLAGTRRKTGWSLAYGHAGGHHVGVVHAHGLRGCHGAGWTDSHRVATHPTWLTLCQQAHLSWQTYRYVLCVGTARTLSLSHTHTQTHRVHRHICHDRHIDMYYVWELLALSLSLSHTHKHTVSTGTFVMTDI